MGDDLQVMAQAFNTIQHLQEELQRALAANNNGNTLTPPPRHPAPSPTFTPSPCPARKSLANQPAETAATPTKPVDDNRSSSAEPPSPETEKEALLRKQLEAMQEHASSQNALLKMLESKVSANSGPLPDPEAKTATPKKNKPSPRKASSAEHIIDDAAPIVTPDGTAVARHFPYVGRCY